MQEINNFILLNYPTRKFLFIFDNLNELDDNIIDIFNTLKTNPNMNFLLTTRNKLLISKADFFNHENKIEIDYFLPVEQKAYWEKCLKKYIDPQMSNEQINFLMSNFSCLNVNVRPYQINIQRIFLVELIENNVLFNVKKSFNH